MAKRSPPIPLETGSIRPSVAFAAIAASTALPPRFRISIPAWVAAGTLVQTIPCRASTSERVAKFLPVMRSIWAEQSGDKMSKRTMRRSANMARSYHCRASKRSRQLGRGDTFVARTRNPIRPNLNVRAHYYCFNRMDRVGRGAGACGAADNWGHDQENLRDTDTHTEAEKEKDFYSGEKEIALPDAEPGKEIL